MTYARKILIPKGSPGTFHCVSRCVRRAFLCGEDRLTRSSKGHPRIRIFLQVIGHFSDLTTWDTHDSEFSDTTWAPFLTDPQQGHAGATTTDTHESEFSYKSSGTFPTDDR